MHFPPDTDLGRTVRPNMIQIDDFDLERIETASVEQINRREAIACKVLWVLIGTVYVPGLLLLIYMAGKGGW